jgi:hypothetical protein
MQSSLPSSLIDHRSLIDLPNTLFSDILNLLFSIKVEPSFTPVTILQDTERLLLWSRHFATQSPLAEASRNIFPRQLQTNFEFS